MGDGFTIAQDISRRIKSELGLTVSIGVSYNKIFAKLGSDYKKPDAITTMGREEYRTKAWPLINVNIKMYIFDHLRMYKFAHSSSCIIYSLKRYDFPVMFITCA